MKSNLFKLVLLFGAIAAVSACGPKAPKGGYIIKGSVEGIPDNAVVQLIPVARVSPTMRSFSLYLSLTR